jgi:RNA polymerase sigma factor (sigma-70 family)
MLDVEALYREHSDYLKRCLRRRLSPSASDALIEDACATAWAIAWRKRREVHEGNEIAWLVTVAWHEALALIKRGRRETCVDAPHERAATSGDPELALAARDALELLADLTPNQRSVMALRIAGLSYAEIARATGRTYTWTNRHISEGRARLRELAA